VDKKLRVAMISFHTNPYLQPGEGNAGGMNVYVAQLAKSLADLGVEVEVFTRASSDLGDATYHLTEIAPSVRLWEISTPATGDLSKKELEKQVAPFTAGVQRVIDEQFADSLDLVHSHYWLSGATAIALKNSRNIPLVHSMHTMGRTKNASLAPGDKPEPSSRIVQEQNIVRQADALVASTNHEVQELITKYCADPGKVVEIPPGVDRETFTSAMFHGKHQPSKAELRQRLNLTPELASGKIILFAGRIQKLKNPSVLVKALPALPTDTYLVILGGASGESLGAHELRKLAKKLGVADRVIVLPPVPAPTLAEWYRAADLVAVPSYNETYGLVAAEAISCGTPVVAADVGGLSTVVHDGVTGRLVPSHEVADWTRVLGELLTDPLELDRLASNCREQATFLDWNAVAAKTREIYQQVTAAK